MAGQAVDVPLQRLPPPLHKVLFETTADLLIGQRAKDQHAKLGRDAPVKPVKVLEAPFHHRTLGTSAVGGRDGARGCSSASSVASIKRRVAGRAIARTVDDTSLYA